MMGYYSLVQEKSHQALLCSCSGSGWKGSQYRPGYFSYFPQTLGNVLKSLVEVNQAII